MQDVLTVTRHIFNKNSSLEKGVRLVPLIPRGA
jgi:hypothetical protein